MSRPKPYGNLGTRHIGCYISDLCDCARWNVKARSSWNTEGLFPRLFLCFFVAGLTGLARELVSDFADSLPGIDEAKSFIEVMG